MNTNFDLKKIWNSQSVAYPNVEEIYAKAEALKRKLRGKAIIAVCLMSISFLVLIACIISEWNDSSIASTQIVRDEIGFIFISMAALIYGFDMLRFVLLIKKTNAISNLNFLQQIIKIKNRLNTNKKISLICLALDYVGIVLLIISMDMPIMWCIASCLFVCGVLIISYFIGKKKMAKRETELNNIIEQLEKLKDAENLDKE